jgi:hypothetical protein
MSFHCVFVGLVALAAAVIPVFLVWAAILFREIHRAFQEGEDHGE